jgi:hypothetical protein
MKISEAASHDLLKLLSLYTNNISVGDRITARVIAVESGILLLQLPDGGNINASVQTDAEYKLGDVLKLEVTGIKQGQVYVRELEHSQAALSKAHTPDPVLILKSLKIPVNNDRLEIVKAMLDMEFEPEADLIDSALKLINEKHVPDAKQAVFLAVNDMAGREEYFPLLNQFAGKTFDFADKWLDLAGQIRQSDEKTLIHFVREFLLYESIQEKDVGVPVNEINNTVPLDSENVSIINEETVKNVILELPLISTETTSGTFQNEINDGAIINAVKQFLPGYDLFPKLTQEAIVKIIRNVFIETINETVFPRTEKEMENIISKFMSLLPKKMQAGTKEHFMPEVDQWLDDIEKKIAIINKVLTIVDRPVNERVTPVLREVETAVRFFQDIQSFEVFAQIPVVLQENISCGELYVMKRKEKRKKIKPEDFSLFLSLTTQYLGVIDAFIHVRNRNVLIKITVEDEKYFDILTGQHKPLYEALKAKGYNLYEIKHVLRDDGVNILNAVKKASETINDNKRIDYRV